MADFGMDDEELEQMYQEVILDAARDPHGRVGDQADGGEDSDGDGVTIRVEHEACLAAESHQFNPTCGDQATIHVEVAPGEQGGPDLIQRIVWKGSGCSISQASLSIMVDLVQGQTVDHAMDLAADFRKLMESRGAGIEDEKAQDALGDAMVFQGVSKYPMRIKCALLGWEGMKASVAQALSAGREGDKDEKEEQA